MVLADLLSPRSIACACFRYKPSQVLPERCPSLERSHRVIIVVPCDFSGARGIQRVEVSVDGESWQAAELNRPLSPLSWVLWRIVLSLEAGDYEIAVRAVDGDGGVQTAATAPPHPDGATGYFKKKITVNA